jgi:uncharacterized protein YegP (UPF0339 family)
MEYPKFRIIRGENKKYYFKLTDAGGEIMLQSGGFKTRTGAERGIEMVKLSALFEERFKCGSTIDGRFFFDLVSVNDDIIGTSRLYKTGQNRDRGIQAVRENAPLAAVEDAG